MRTRKLYKIGYETIERYGNSIYIQIVAVLFLVISNKEEGIQ